MDCGPTCLKMIFEFYGRKVTIEFVRKLTNYHRSGVSLSDLANAAETIGLKAVGVKLSADELIIKAPLPAILLWKDNHYVILTSASRKSMLIVADPAIGLIRMNKNEFLKNWCFSTVSTSQEGIALFFEPTANFCNIELSNNKYSKGKNELLIILSYIKQYKRYFFYAFSLLLIGSLLQLLFPYLTQGIVDKGIKMKNINFIQLILIGQLTLLVSRTIIDFIRARIVLFISTRVYISLLSTFWRKFLRIPMSFHETRQAGDIIQRVADLRRVESFITGSAINTIFSILTIIAFSFILLSYNSNIFIIYWISISLYFVCIYTFLERRKTIDHAKFELSAKDNTSTMQMINGVHEIKLNNAETLFEEKVASIQKGLFNLKVKNLTLNQIQQSASIFINEGKNIFITYLVSIQVIEGKLTLGAMLAIQYIIGQLNSPIEQLVSISQQTQDAKLSLHRLNDLHKMSDEEPHEKPFQTSIPLEADIKINNVSFAYPGSGNEAILKKINLTIPYGKVTALVGLSGSGKSTLLKILLKYFENYDGTITIGDADLKNISSRYWRSMCGAVLQEGFIFNDTIGNNIVIAKEGNDSKLIQVSSLSNIYSFISSLPLGFNSKIGDDGNGISSGQRQRILMARAIYKDPKFIFFDEATNSLDAKNESEILEKLYREFKGRTVIIVAHRLSTIRHANKIAVFENGEIVEEGSHEELIETNGVYLNLINKQFSK